MNFLEPVRLWVLLGVAAFAVVYVVLQRRRLQYAVRFTNLALLDAVAPRRPGWRRHATAVGFLLALTALVVAFARPTHDEKVPRERATVMVAIDVSLSMEATDVDPTRLDAVKIAAKNFVDQLPPKINVGLVSFSASSRVDVSPTTDRTRVKRAIDLLELNEGTAIGEAIFSSLSAIAQQALADDSASEKVPARIVLMSDGKTTQGRANALAIDAAVKAKVPVSTIAFGTDHGEILVPQEPVPVPVPVDREALQEIADQTGGSFFSAASTEELEKVYADIGSSIGFDFEPREISSWFVGLALLALIATAGMSLAWFNRLP